MVKAALIVKSALILGFSSGFMIKRPFRIHLWPWTENSCAQRQPLVVKYALCRSEISSYWENSWRPAVCQIFAIRAQKFPRSHLYCLGGCVLGSTLLLIGLGWCNTVLWLKMQALSSHTWYRRIWVVLVTACWWLWISVPCTSNFYSYVHSCPIAKYMVRKPSFTATCWWLKLSNIQPYGWAMRADILLLELAVLFGLVLPLCPPMSNKVIYG